MLVGHTRKLLDVEDLAARVRDGLAKQSLGVGTERSGNFFLRGLWVDEGALDAQLLQCDTKEVVGATIDLVRGDEMVACLTDVENGIEISCLAA